MASKKELPIETERLELRSFQKSDLDAMMAYHALPDVQRYLDWKARDRVEVKAALDAMVKQNRLTRPGEIIHIAVTRKSDNVLIGQISLRWTDATAGQAELRFIFSPFHRKQGYATEAVTAAMDFGFENFHFHRIFARCAGKNQASARLLKGIGMRLEAHYREHALFKGVWDEEMIYAMLEDEWAAL
ncbi:MAG: N-acetyltransferase, partial [Hyphomicrobiales bacterium]